MDGGPAWWDERVLQRPREAQPASGGAASTSRRVAHVDLDCVYLRSCVLSALARRPAWTVRSETGSGEEPCAPAEATFSWAEYERIDWERVLTAQDMHTCAYCVRKGLIRKSNLAFSVRKWVAKHPEGALAVGVPETLLFEFWDLEYLDEALSDVYEVRDMAADGSEWWILKPSMTNQGRGILVFNRLAQLVAALSVDGADEVREWVLQRYIRRPLLVGGRKFHLRVYALAVGALAVHMYDDVLTLFSLADYDGEDPSNAAAHITNTCVQHPASAAEVAAAVGLLRDLPARLAADGMDGAEAAARCSRVHAECAALVGEAFQAVASELSFLPLERSFELYGFDFLVDAEWRVFLLEANAQPDFAQTGGPLRAVVAGVVEGALALSLDAWHPAHAAPRAQAPARGYLRVYERQDPRAAGSAMSFA